VVEYFPENLRRN